MAEMDKAWERFLQKNRELALWVRKLPSQRYLVTRRLINAIKLSTLLLAGAFTGSEQNHLNKNTSIF